MKFILKRNKEIINTSDYFFYTLYLTVGQAQDYPVAGVIAQNDTDALEQIKRHVAGLVMLEGMTN